jgi:hypothetical protein
MHASKQASNGGSVTPKHTLPKALINGRLKADANGAAAYACCQGRVYAEETEGQLIAM